MTEAISFFYRQIESLQEYILIEQDKAQIEIYKREANLWSINRISGLGEMLFIDSLGIEIVLRAIYGGVL